MNQYSFILLNLKTRNVHLSMTIVESKKGQNYSIGSKCH